MLTSRLVHLCDTCGFRIAGKSTLNATVDTTSSLPSRLVPLEGAVNFRDIGGYPAAGRTIRWGKVFRAGVLCYFTPSDQHVLARLGVRAICDLRRNDERQREPTRWPAALARQLSWEDGENMPTIRGFAAQRPRTAAGMRAAMLDLYRALPNWMGPRIRGLFQCLADEHVPVVVHCAAGKDRTGIAIAVLLAALGVDTDTILEDYLLTNDVGNFERFIAARKDSHLGLADAHQPLLSLPQEMRQVLFAADADYLSAALEQIARDHGDVATYLKSFVGLDERTIGRVCDLMLE
jgi:protein-tyrosine phosphatase